MTTLTDTFLASPKRKLEAGNDKYDENGNGLGVRWGKKRHTWFIRTRKADGGYSRETIGYYPMKSLAEARAEAADRANRIERGIPLTATAPAKPTALLTIGTLMDRYEQARRKDGLKSIKAMMQVLRNGFRDFAKIELAAFTKNDMKAAHSGMSDGGRGAGGNLFLRYACGMFNWAIEEDLTDRNWAGKQGRIKRAKVPPRERVLSMDELAAIWHASTRLGNDTTRVNYGRMIRFLMLTGQRLSEAGELRYGEVDFAGQWTQTVNKSSRRHVLRLPEAAMAEVDMGHGVLGARVFGSARGAKITNTDSYMKTLRKLSGVTKWSAHTLRHTMVTHLAEAQVPLEVTEALLNHKLGGVAGVYHHAKHEGPKQAALKLWAGMIAAQIGNCAAVA